MERTPAIAAAFEHARTLAALLGLELGEGSVGGTSDANLLAHHGVARARRPRTRRRRRPRRGRAHRLDSLVQRAALIALLLAAPPG